MNYFILTSKLLFYNVGHNADKLMPLSW